MKGYCYLVTRFIGTHEPDKTRVKIGFLTNYAVEAELHKWYSRSLTPLCILCIIPIGNARVAEGTIHFALDKFRLNPNHEIFDLSSSYAWSSFENAARLLKELQHLSGTPLPLVRPFDYQHWRMARDAARVGKTRMNKLERKIAADNVVEENRRRRLSEQQNQQKQKAECMQLAEQTRKLERALDVEADKTDALQSFFRSKILLTENEKEFITRAEMFRLFESSHRDTQNIKKTRVDKKVFFTALLDFVGKHRHISKKYHQSDIIVKARIQGI